MTPFNELPLPEQIGQLQKGDLVTTDIGAVLPFYCRGGDTTLMVKIVTNGSIGVHHNQITAIHRPEPPVPEIVKKLREFRDNKYEYPAEELAAIISDYFEQEVRK